MIVQNKTLMFSLTNYTNGSTSVIFTMFHKAKLLSEVKVFLYLHVMLDRGHYASRTVTRDLKPSDMAFDNKF